MMTTVFRRSFSAGKFLPVLTLSVLLAGCAGEAAFREGKSLLAEGKLEDGLNKLQLATKEAPDNLEFRMGYLNARDATIQNLLAQAQRERRNGHFDDAESFLKQVLRLDQVNALASTELISVEQARRHTRLVKEATDMMAANDLDGADQKLALVLLENPQHAEAKALKRQLDEKGGRNQVIPPSLRKTLKKPINLELRDANLKQMVEALSRHSGLNFILDKDVPGNLSTTIFLRQVSVEDALDVILTTHNLERRLLNDTTLLIYPNTAAKQTEHQDLVVKSFYLSNANAKQVMEMLKSVIKAKNLYVDEKINLLIMRDTPSAIRLAERLVALQDVAEPEVMLEVQVMEVQRTRLQQLGIQFPDQLTLTPLASKGSTVTLQDLRDMKASTVGATLSNTIINLHKDVGDSNILANPRIRTHNREKAEIKIGDRVPVITTTSTSTGFVAENVQYVDVGLKLNVEPTIYPDSEIAIKVGLEVSSVVKEVISKAGSLSYQIGSRNASTMLRLRDGETQILGGLINDQDRSTANRVPGLGDIPVLGRLFASQKDDTQKTELVLSITPRLIRGIGPPPQVPTEFWSGTENNLRLKPLAVISSKEAAPASPVASSQKPSTGAAALPAQPEPAADFDSPSIQNDSPTAPSSGTGTSAPLLQWDGTPKAKVGSNLQLTVKVSSQEGLMSFPLQIKYDPTVLELSDVSPGGFLAQNNAKVNFTQRVVAGSGMAFLTQSQTGKAVKGDGDLLALKFKALKPSASSVVSILPAVAIGAGNKPLPQSGPTMIGVTVTP